MKIAIVSDTQSNAHALKAVLDHMSEANIDVRVHLGNIVGLCAEPNKTIEMTMMNFNYITAGDSDLDMLDKVRLNWLKPSNREIAEWSFSETTESNKDILSNLEHGYYLVENDNTNTFT